MAPFFDEVWTLELDELVVKDANRRIELDSFMTRENRHDIKAGLESRVSLSSEVQTNTRTAIPIPLPLLPRLRVLHSPSRLQQITSLPTRAISPDRECKRGNAALAVVAWDIVGNRAPSSALWWRRDMGSDGCKCNANPLPDREGACATVDGHAERCGGTMGALLMGDIQG